VSFWRKEVIDFALDQETRTQIDEQRTWIEREPANPKPYYHLAELYRIAFRQDEALGLLLEAVRLDPAFADAHVSLAEIYITRSDDEAARRHALLAEQQGNPEAANLLRRYQLL
jgi:cytochrome c-type biogenesis protein CcmH/NrfG